MDIKEIHEVIDTYLAGHEISSLDTNIHAYCDFYETTITIVGTFHPKKESNRLYFGIPKKETT